MTDPADYQMRTPPTWPRDFGTLKAVADWVAQRPPNEIGNAESVAAVTGLDATLIRESLARWEDIDPPAIVFSPSGEDFHVYDLTERGRRLVGLWPSPDDVL